jgi:hypothetical protein
MSQVSLFCVPFSGSLESSISWPVLHEHRAEHTVWESPFPRASIAHSKINVCPLCLWSSVTPSKWNLDMLRVDHATQDRPLLDLIQRKWGWCSYELCFFSLSGSLSDGAGDPTTPVYPQPPSYQPSDYGITVPSEQLQGNPLPMMSQEDSPFPTWEPWNPSYPLSVPHLLPGFVPGDANLQQPWSTCDLHQDPQWREVGIPYVFPVNLRIMQYCGLRHLSLPPKRRKCGIKRRSMKNPPPCLILVVSMGSIRKEGQWIVIWGSFPGPLRLTSCLSPSDFRHGVSSPTRGTCASIDTCSRLLLSLTHLLQNPCPVFHSPKVSTMQAECLELQMDLSSQAIT